MALPSVHKAVAPDIHGDEPAINTPVDQPTEIAIDQMNNDQLNSANKSLTDLSTIQSQAAMDTAKAKTKVSTNISSLQNSPINIPTPKIPDINTTIGNVNGTLQNIGTQAVNKIRTSLSTTVRDPSKLAAFEQNKAALVIGGLTATVSSLIASVAAINGLKNSIAKKLGG